MRHAVGYLQALRRSKAHLARSLPRFGRRLSVACGELRFRLPRERCAEPLVEEEDVGLGWVEVPRHSIEAALDGTCVER